MVKSSSRGVVNDAIVFFRSWLIAMQRPCIMRRAHMFILTVYVRLGIVEPI
jgi:hypothetical protein